MCIRQWDWSETSQTVSIFTRAHGVVRCVAKGAKRENARFSGGLEVMTRGDLVASLKTGETMSILASWDLAEVFPAARRSLSSFHAGMTMLDIVQHSLQDHDPHPALYDALVTALRDLGEPDPERRALLRLLWAALSETGHRPELTADVASGEALAPAEIYLFLPRLGGVSANGAAASGPAWRVRKETIGLLRCIESTPAADEATIERATRLLAMYFREVFGADPRTFARLLGEQA